METRGKQRKKPKCYTCKCLWKVSCGLLCLNVAAGVWKKTQRIFQLFQSWHVLFLFSSYCSFFQFSKSLITWCFFCLLFRWKQTRGTAVPSRLGLDLAGERILRRRRRGQVPGGGPQAERIPGRDVVHRLVLLCLFLFERRPLPVCHIRRPGWDGAEHWVHTQDETASICLPSQLQS